MREHLLPRFLLALLLALGLALAALTRPLAPGFALSFSPSPRFPSTSATAWARTSGPPGAPSPRGRTSWRRTKGSRRRWPALPRKTPGSG